MSHPRKSRGRGAKLFITVCIVGALAVSGYVMFGDQLGLRSAAPADSADVQFTANVAPVPRVRDNLGKKRGGG